MPTIIVVVLPFAQVNGNRSPDHAANQILPKMPELRRWTNQIQSADTVNKASTVEEQGKST